MRKTLRTSSTNASMLQKGLAHHRAGRLAEASAFYSRILRKERKHPDALNLSGIIARQSGDLETSQQLIARAIAQNPRAATYHHNFGRTCELQGNTAQAVQSYQAALLLDPKDIDSMRMLAALFLGAGRAEEAAALLQRAIAIDPQHAETLNSLGRVLHELGDLDAARSAYSEALKLQPDLPEALSNLGALSMDMGDLQTAEHMLRLSIKARPDFLNAHSTLGALLERKGDPVGATQEFRQVLMVDPGHVPTLCNLGLTLEHLGDQEGAAACYKLALEREPDTPLARFNLSLHLLADANFSDGWKEYEHRWRTRQFAGKRRTLPQPQWRGEELGGSPIYIYAEQGQGDTIHFFRYALDLAGRDVRVILEVQPAMVRLLSGLHPLVQVVPQGFDPLPAFDWHTPLLSLPGVFHSRPANLPARVPYLRACAGEVAQWSQRISGDGVRVGLVWSGNPEHTRDRQRSISLAQFGPLTALTGAAFYSLQKGPAARQLESLPQPRRPMDLDPWLADFADTAAAIANLDLVITVDTAVAHLAGAMGKEVWILLPFIADWRWLKLRSDSPWYPTATLFRQNTPGDWEDVLQRVEEALVQRVRQGGSWIQRSSSQGQPAEAL